MMAAVSTSIKLDPDMKDRVLRVAESMRRTPHWVMKEAVEKYITDAERREAWERDSIEALKEMDETGLHVTGEEVMVWLESWGTDDEKPAPECHL
jgi:predicted transcriptional regulator